MVESIDMRSAARRIEKDDSVGRRGMMPLSRCERIRRCSLKLTTLQFTAHPCQGNCTKST